MEPKQKKIAGIVDSSVLLGGSTGRRKVDPVSTALWFCEHCKAEFKHENSFMKHHCIQMDRAQTIKTPAGQSAYMYYCDWFKTLKRKAPPIETFIHSKNYNAFLRLVDFFKKVNLASSMNYIRFMADSDISPVLWCRDQSYSMYLTYLDSQYDPKEAVKDTIGFLLKEANSAEITSAEFLSAMTLKDIAVLTQRRLITPYFLIFSHEFRSILQNATAEERNVFVKQVPLQFWANKLMADEKLTTTIRGLVKGEKL